MKIHCYSKRNSQEIFIDNSTLKHEIKIITLNSHKDRKKQVLGFNKSIKLYKEGYLILNIKEKSSSKLVVSRV